MSLFRSHAAPGRAGSLTTFDGRDGGLSRRYTDGMNETVPEGSDRLVCLLIWKCTKIKGWRMNYRWGAQSYVPSGSYD